MPLLSYNDIMRDLKAGRYAPVYLLMGDEEYFIDEVTRQIADNALPAAQRDFNQTVLYGDQATVAQIIIEARRYPMMADRQVLIVKEAQNVRGIDGAGEEKESPWAAYMQNPMRTTVLVIALRGKTLDKRKKLYKAIEKNGVILEAKRLYENKMPDWIHDYAKSRGYEIQAAAALTLVAHLGTNLTKIANAFGKLTTLLPQGTIINGQHIEDNIGISKDYNIFELQKAIGQRDTTRALTIVAHFARNPKENPIQVVVGQLFNYFLKIIMVHTSYRGMDRNTLAQALGVNAYFVGEYQEAARNFPLERAERAVNALRHYDAFSKGVGSADTDSGELLKEMVCVIMM